mmetsp:Transcript_1931/g.8542  ORF Transcript_1931/g.8542 Transcript_1931/m.8542 type:complete len:586 (+) Transcript_1931:157-1914(+)
MIKYPEQAEGPSLHHQSKQPEQHEQRRPRRQQLKLESQERVARLSARDGDQHGIVCVLPDEPLELALEERDEILPHDECRQQEDFDAAPSCGARRREAESNVAEVAIALAPFAPERRDQAQRSGDDGGRALKRSVHEDPDPCVLRLVIGDFPTRRERPVRLLAPLAGEEGRRTGQAERSRGLHHGARHRARVLELVGRHHLHRNAHGQHGDHQGNGRPTQHPIAMPAVLEDLVAGAGEEVGVVHDRGEVADDQRQRRGDHVEEHTILGEDGGLQAQQERVGAGVVEVQLGHEALHGQREHEHLDDAELAGLLEEDQDVLAHLLGKRQDPGADLQQDLEVGPEDAHHEDGGRDAICTALLRFLEGGDGGQHNLAGRAVGRIREEGVRDPGVRQQAAELGGVLVEVDPDVVPQLLLQLLLAGAAVHSQARHVVADVRGDLHVVQDGLLHHGDLGGLHDDVLVAQDGVCHLLHEMVDAFVDGHRIARVVAHHHAGRKVSDGEERHRDGKGAHQQHLGAQVDALPKRLSVAEARRAAAGQRFPFSKQHIVAQQLEGGGHVKPGRKTAARGPKAPQTGRAPTTPAVQWRD